MQALFIRAHSMGKTEAKVDLYRNLIKAPSTIQIYGAPNSTPSTENQKLDEIDATAHESFTLEEMRVLVLNYKKKNKDFLLARVTTQDVEDKTIFYNFYYAASEINRILFRYEPSRHLLHRMKVKNPLNNMYIIGQVYYYKITPHEADKAIVNYLYNAKKDKDAPKKAFSAIFRKKMDFFSSERKRKSKDSMDITESPKDIKDAQGISPREVIEKLLKGEVQIPEVADKKRRIQYCAKYFASDDDFLIKQETREYFKRNALEPEDDFLYDLDRTHNDLLALLDEDSQEEDEENVSDWRRVLSAHVSLAVAMLFICLVMGGGPGVIIIFLPMVIVIFFSFIASLCYVMCCRRGTFDSIAVNSVEDEL